MNRGRLILAGLLALLCPAWSAPGAGSKLDEAWERAYAARVKWWSLQPIRVHPPPTTQNTNWPRNFVDAFILARLEEKQLAPAPEADRPTLARRLSFALTGLPPSRASWERFVQDPSPQAFETFVRSLLDSPAFGEHWARHWMDVVHYADTHGYEWDAPAKNAWRYRDYLIRAFNTDVPVNRLLLEQIAGDLIEPRLDASGTLNESLIGLMALRLGERRHGDNAAAEGVTQEATANVIDTVGKGFLATTVACAQCHDHKLDAVAQQDFFALAGIFMSTRWVVRSVDATDPNEAILKELRVVKGRIRAELARLWLSSRPHLLAALADTRSTNPPPAGIPDTLRSLWLRCSVQPPARDEFSAEQARRRQANRENLRLVADFASPDPQDHGGWRWDGFGMKHGHVPHGELVLREDGPQPVRHLLPAGRWSHVWSPRLAGALRSPLFPTGIVTTVSLELAAGQHAAQAMIVDQAFHSERMQFLDVPFPAWKTFTAGKFDTLEGGIDTMPRRAYLELVTKALNNYFPPRTGYGGLKESDLDDERSWVGASRVHQHPPGRGPQDELDRFAPLFTGDAGRGGDWTNRFADLLLDAVTRWSRNETRREDVQLINEALQLRWLTNDLQASPLLAELVAAYRDTEHRLQPDRTVGSAEEWHEARNERIGIRGSYTEFGPEAPRGNIRFLRDAPLHPGPAGPGSRQDTSTQASGRLEFAQSIAHDQNPLSARVVVNRVWQHLFGEGLVRTPDDFGHLGEKPSHPELLDTLTAEFIRDGWSLKRLVARLVTSATWRQDSRGTDQARAVDPENSLRHHYPPRRLEAEAVRDALLAVSGRLDPALYGPPINPYRTAEDAAKRLFRGPLDGAGRRSIYLKMTLMEPPRFLALFNQPIPKLTTGRRDVTQVPDQALALLNDPFVQLMARQWSERLLRDGAASPETRVDGMIADAFARPARTGETDRLVRLAHRFATLRAVPESGLMNSREVWQDTAHALFNLNEFTQVY